MIQVAHIYPFHSLKYGSFFSTVHCRPIHMLLTHLVHEYPKYAQFARDFRGYKILDNSLIEQEDNKALDIETVLEAADIVNASEIVLPDAFQDGAKTLALVEEALDYLSKRDFGLPNYTLQAVVQGKDDTEWLHCYDQLSRMKEIKILGIPKVLDTDDYCLDRIPLLDRAVRLYGTRGKHFHLLGMWYCLDRLEQMLNVSAETYYHTRSLDTSLHMLNAINGHPLLYSREDDDKIDLSQQVSREQAVDMINYIWEAREYVSAIDTVAKFTFRSRDTVK